MVVMVKAGRCKGNKYTVNVATDTESAVHSSSPSVFLAISLGFTILSEIFPYATVF